MASVYLSHREVTSGDATAPAHAAWEGLQAVLTGARREFQLEYPSGDGDDERWSLLRVCRSGSDDGPLRVVVAHDDITQRVQATRALRGEHVDYRWMLANETGGRYAATLTRQLLAFSRRQVLEPKALDLNHAVRDVEMMLRRLIGEDVLLITRLAPALGTVMVDPNNMVQVLMNLVVIARDAMPDVGMIVISTTNVAVAAPRDVAGDTLIPGAYVAARGQRHRDRHTGIAAREDLRAVLHDQGPR